MKNVFITLGEEGVFYSDKKLQGIMKAKRIVPKNATGAGDAFQAALVHAELNDMEIRDKVRFSMAASILAMSSYSTINKEISVESIYETMKHMEEK